MRLAWAVVLLLAVDAATGLTSAAFGQPRIVQVGCDALGLAPPLVRVQFRGEWTCESRPIAFYMVPLQPSPTPSDTCSAPILQCGGPPGWDCRAANGEAFWWPSEGGCIPRGAALDSFTIITDAYTDLSSCCYETVFYYPIPENSFYDTFCFTCDLPVPTRRSTWGELKSLYR
jgi:hypothetical protein